ncbi:YncE family protein [Bacillus norwichensis]|uniref:WD40 repeat domain-containing protein n=1 Tax=Bacillus norwichensis TaxID=2762217 RepID=A0ABR8VQL5_9BACI|nr:WD40 repeat domain-containing protein [Bacillus norwichensis]MBD8007066.1 WD40 repeat domain-containing protein [Bacillus norwichensis]
MSKPRLIFILLTCFFILSGCLQKKQQPIDEGQLFTATLNVGDFSIDFLNTAGEKFARWELKKPYTGATLLPDGDTLILYGPEIEEVDFYSLKNGSLKKSFKSGKGISNVLYLESDAKFAFADKVLNQVRFFDKNGKETQNVKTAEYPMAMEADKEKLYVASFKGAMLSIINLKNHEIEKEFKIPASTAGMLLREKEIWIGGHGKGDEPQSDISVYSLRTGNLVKEIPAPLMPINFFENDKGIYALSHGTNMLYQYNPDKELIKKTEVGANPFAIDSFDGKLVVTGFDSEKLYWVDPETLDIERAVDVGKGPFVIFTREKVK